MTGKINPAHLAQEKKAKKAKLKRITKWLVIAAIITVAIICAAIYLPKLMNTQALEITSITTYNVEAVTTGDVNTTISGSGTLTPVTKENLTADRDITVTEVLFNAGESVDEGEVIITATYTELDAEGNEAQTEIEYTAPYDCVILEMPLKADDQLKAGGQIAMLMGKDGFTMGIAVDENDIATAQVGQQVDFTVDAVNGEYVGEITAVSYNGSTSGGNTAYQLTAYMEYAEGIYPGMSVSAEIVIESSGEGLLVPVTAIQTSGNNDYVYIAPGDADAGDEYDEDEIDISSLTKVYVDTGMSDGTYILIETDNLSDGDLIIVPTVTSTQTGSNNTGNGGFGGGMGGFGGGGFGGGGMNFGDFDFENFDPGNMPGGFPCMQ